MDRLLRVEELPPPTYEEALAAMPRVDAPFVPPRYGAASEGRNSIKYDSLPPVYDTTKIYLVDNKSTDVRSLNYQSDRSHYLTTVIQNADGEAEAAGRDINLDDRSRWGGAFRSILNTNMPNVTEYMFSNSFRARLMSKKENGVPTYEWFTLTLPEGNYPDSVVLDLMNNAVLENYLAHGRMHGVPEEDIGVKFDTRNLRLGYDPDTGLITPGAYTFEAMHGDVLLLPGCAVDFTHSRLNNLLGIRKRLPYQPGFVIAYEDLQGGNVPALMDAVAYNGQPRAIRAVTHDPSGRSYHVGEDPEARPTDTAYRSWYLAYNYGPAEGTRAHTLLTASDVTCGAEQLYWSLPDMAVEPVTFRASQKPEQYPVVGAELLPLHSRSFFNLAAVYSQLIGEETQRTKVFNRFPDNQILLRPPAPVIGSISENVPALTDHGILPIRNRIAGVQRVALTDARRRTCPYVYKSLGIVSPRVLSSRTL